MIPVNLSFEEAVFRFVKYWCEAEQPTLYLNTAIQTQELLLSYDVNDNGGKKFLAFLIYLRVGDVSINSTLEIKDFADELIKHFEYMNSLKEQIDKKNMVNKKETGEFRQRLTKDREILHPEDWKKINNFLTDMDRSIGGKLFETTDKIEWKESNGIYSLIPFIHLLKPYLLLPTLQSSEKWFYTFADRFFTVRNAKGEFTNNYSDALKEIKKKEFKEKRVGWITELTDLKESLHLRSGWLYSD